jgi:hypothetical protein
MASFVLPSLWISNTTNHSRSLISIYQGRKDAVVAANLAYEPIKAFDNSVGTSGASAFYSAGNGLERALDGFLKAAGDAKF